MPELTRRETMTSRERVIRTLRREPVDRVPLDLGSHMSTGISAFAYWRLREYLGLPVGDIWVPDVVQFLAYVEEDVRQRLHLDCILLQPPWPRSHVWSPRAPYRFRIPASAQPQRNDAGEWILTQDDRAMRMPPGGSFFDGAWLSKWSELDEADGLTLLAAEARRIAEETEYATNFVGYGYGIGFGAFFGGFEHVVEMLDDPEGVKAQHEAELAASIARAGRVIDAVGDRVQLLTISDDMGMQNGPMCRPALVEEFIVPYLSRFCDFVHRHSDIKIFMHNCGSIKPLIPLLIDCGVDVLNPVQISADDMDPRELKAAFGDRIVFWGGGCDTQHVLSTATPEAVTEHVRANVAAFKPNGGFVFNQVHNILADVPPENIVAMFDAAYAAGWYDAPEAGR